MDFIFLTVLVIFLMYISYQVGKQSTLNHLVNCSDEFLLMWLNQLKNLRKLRKGAKDE